MKRVVVSGIGSITCLGKTALETFAGIKQGKVGLKILTEEDVPQIQDMPIKIGGKVEVDYEVMKKLPFAPNKQNAMILSAAEEALQDSKWNPQTKTQKERTGVFMGAIKSYISPLLFFSEKILEEGCRSIPDAFNQQLSIFNTTANIAKLYDFKGPTSAYGSACAAGQSSIAEAYFGVQEGLADVIVAGSADFFVDTYDLMGFHKLGALNKKANQDPYEGLKTFDENRAGFAGSDGAGVLVLEELEHALSRNAPIYAEIIGASQISESFHATRPSPNGEGICKSMLGAMEMANVDPREIEVINSHGTGTSEGDLAEATAIYNIFGAPGPYVMGIKSNLGHCMGGSGTVQCSMLMLAMKESFLPRIPNIENPMKVNNESLNFLTENIEKPFTYALSNNAGFGGLNVSLLFKKYTG
mmetsp:Transcript_8359/g.12335  ORF Transcript_8359/g.12335 Transcript_8359/m.12335 type:complete len:414 (+) Transcript_8359:17-1258(+)